MAQKILVLGGTGAMGVYLVPILAEMGYLVDVVSLDDVQSTNPSIRYIQANAKDPQVRAELLSKHYDGIVDFMIYNMIEDFQEAHRTFLQSTGHYIYLSTYRIYANEEVPIKETSPRLLDVSKDQEYLATRDYSLYKAQGEDLLHAAPERNWTIIRPAITYSKRRFQLVTLEAPVVVYRAMRGLPVAIPADAMTVQATMSWAGDVAKMISRLLFNDRAMGEIFSVCTAEHRPWGEVAEYYKDLIGLKYVPVSTQDYLMLLGGSKGAVYQLMYDRMFERVMDNSKVLDVTGMQQSELTTLYDGLERELRALPKDVVWPESLTSNRMDQYFKV